MAYDLAQLNARIRKLKHSICCLREELEEGGSLPDQTGHAGEFLTTDGSVLSWDSVAGGGWGTTGTVATLTSTASLNIATNSFAMVGTNYFDGLFFVGDDGSASLGDYQASVNGTRIDIADAASTIAYNATGGHTFTGGITASTLAGTGNRLVTASATGVLSATEAIPVDYSLKAYAALGGAIVAQPINVTFNDIAISGYIQQSTLLNIIAVWLPTAQTITGVKWVQNTQGDYTASNYNGVGLYTYSGGTLTLVASSTDDGDIWKAAIGVRSKAFSSTYAASAGLYFIATLYSNSANVITPRLGKANANGSGYVTGGDFTNGAKLTSTLAAQTSMPASITASATTVDNNILYVGLY